MPNPYTRHIKPKKPESLPMRIWGYIGAGIAWLLFGVFMLVWNLLTRDKYGRKKRAFRDMEDL
jgi:hypothetical protein